MPQPKYNGNRSGGVKRVQGHVYRGVDTSGPRTPVAVKPVDDQHPFTCPVCRGGVRSRQWRSYLDPPEYRNQTLVGNHRWGGGKGKRRESCPGSGTPLQETR